MAAQGVNVLITGANRGLGLEMVKQMLETFRPLNKLFAGCRDPDGPRADALKALANKHPDIISILRLDTSDFNSIKNSAKQVGSVVGAKGLHLLVNNAGILINKGIAGTTAEDMESSYNVNVIGPMCMLSEYLPYLRAAAKTSSIPGMSARKAAVVNISTQLASLHMLNMTYDSFPGVAYRTSKASLNMLTRCAAQEFAKEDILCSMLHPGWVRTEMGGEAADIDAVESVQGMLQVIKTMSSKQNGVFLDYKGNTLPW
ncbi:uncharacterized protein V6R79_010693 [Siganus canaliculatus]